MRWWARSAWTAAVAEVLTRPAPRHAGPLLVDTPQALRAALDESGRVGLVPTMGYLHEGHAALIRRARQSSDRVVVSVFVNPMQFGRNEDLGRYPRDLERDLRVAGEAGADVIFHPEPGTMYPPGFASAVQVSGVSEPLDGAARPGHFAGVATVVLKLLNLVQPAQAFFGEKDWQQLAVVRRMVTDLNVPTEIVGVPTVRADSGLALSSRNSYLSAEQQAQAVALSAALRAVQRVYAAGERDVAALKRAGLDTLTRDPAVQPEYLSVVGPDLRETGTLTPDPLNRVLVAARVGGVRLIDNMPLLPGSASGLGRADAPL